ncbi:universal stress protein [soil metagenome]
MKNILVPVDFSEVSKNAAEFAVRFAKVEDAKVKLLHVYHIPVPSSADVPTMLISSDELQAMNDSELLKIKESIKVSTGFDVSTEARLGAAVDVILEESVDADLIVMGIHGAGAIAETIIGSIATDTLRKSTIPVLVVPEHTRYKNPDKIVLACDYNPDTNLRSLDTLTDLMENFNSKIFVVNVKNKKDKSISEETDTMVVLDSKLSIYKLDIKEHHESATSEEKAIREKIEKKLANIEHYYFSPEKKDVVNAINEFVDEKNADMVAIIPHHYKLFEGLFHKSLSKKMAFHTHVPLLALPDNK